VSSRPALRVIEGGGRPAAAPAGAVWEFAVLGLGLTFSAALLGRLPAWFHNLGVFQGLYALAFAFYALALLRSRRFARIPHAGVAVFAVALAARAALWPATPSLSGDLYRYLWEGRVLVEGGDPYRQSPLDPALTRLRDARVFPRVNHPELATIYPPLAEAGFALVARIAPTVGAFKLWVVLHDLALVLLLLAWARQRGESAVPVIAYAWNPLVLVEFSGTGHNEPTALVWLALALMTVRRRPLLSALALAAGALVKLAPLVALPFLWREWTARARLAALVALALGLGVYALETRGAASGLHAYWSSWRNNPLLFDYLERGIGSFAGARVVSLLLLGATLAWCVWKRWQPAPATRLGLRAGFLVSPVAHPWYLGWVLMFEPLGPAAPWLLLSLTAVLSYGLLATPAAGRDFHLPLTWRWVEYGLPLLLAAVLAAARRRRGSGRAGEPGGA
jgi:hypothetical protein